MILYKAIRYKIIDYCLSILFDRLNENFNAFKKIYAKDLYPGMTLRKIKYGLVLYNNCEIIKITPSRNYSDLLHFKFTYSSIEAEVPLKWYSGILFVNEKGKFCNAISIIDNRNGNHIFEFIE